MCICVRSSPYVVLSHTSYYKRAKYRIGGANSRCQPVNFICESAFMSNILICVRLEPRPSVHDRSNSQWIYSAKREARMVYI